MNQRLRARNFLLIAAALLWLFVVVLNYYIVHKPFALENILALSNAGGDILTALLIALTASALGHRALRALEFSAPLESLVFEIGFGLGILSLVMLALGVIGILQRAAIWGAIVIAVGLLRNDLRGVVRQIRALKLEAQTRWTRALMLFTAFVLFVAGLFALLPPTAWDAQTYHLVKAQTAIAQGRIGAPPDIPYFSFPSLGEMLFLLAMLLKGDIAAQWLHFLFFVLLLGAVLAYARRSFSVQVGWLAVAVLAAVPSLLALATWAYVDAMLMFYAFAAFYALARACEAKNAKWVAVAGTCAGFALGTKYTAVIVPVALFCLMLVRRDWNLKQWLILGGACALFAAPWFLRNLVFTGTPI
jgi:hypothetical protein